MKSKQIVIMLVVLVVIIAAYFAFSKNRTVEAPKVSSNEEQTLPNDQANENAAESSAEQAATTPQVTTESKGVFSDENNAMDVDAQVFEVVYDGKVFLPNSLDIKQGDIVFFKNSSTKSFWPASNPHPTHTAYPEFDAKSAMKPGQTFEFKFLKTGTWGFHDHLNSSASGTITVTK
jgi:plastocyanin